jgi:23S rRNA (guanosine2251-2'-O)-methyltransferase
MRKLTMEELDRLSVDEFRKAPKIPVVLLLDNVRSLHNVGSAFRTADAFSCQRIVLTGITGTPPHREIHKTALGATESVEWTYMARPEEAARQLKSEGYRLVVVEQTTDSQPLHELVVDRTEKICVVFGNELNGVSDEVIALADGAIDIPQSGTKHSLNISVCVGIVCWELFKRMRAT